jgi:hypothetical protein
MPFEPRPVTVPVFAPKPIAAEPVPQNPAMAPNGRNNMHNDSYMTDTYAWAGPKGGKMVLRHGAVGGIGLCPTITFDAKGRLVTVCSGVNVRTQQVSRRLLLIDPKSLKTLAACDLPSGGGGSTGFGGGGYIFLNNKDQAVLPTANQQIWIVDIEDDALVPTRVFDLASTIGDAAASLQSSIPDWSGRLWWVTDTGKVGYTDPASGISWAVQLDAPQQIGNSFATDETGGVFIASNYAMYRFDVAYTGQLPQVTWCYSYDRGMRMKPGQQNFGTGTTPTLVGSEPHRSYCGITDNADPQMHVVVYHRQKDYDGNRIVCEVPVFPKNYSDTENSLIGYLHKGAHNGTFCVENNYGYTGTISEETGPVAPGLAKVDFDGKDSRGKAVWENDRIVIPSVVSKLSLANGLLYTYTLEIHDGVQSWYVSAVDSHTGEVAYKIHCGDGLAFDNHYASLYIGPDGTLYVPVWSGILALSEA